LARSCSNSSFPYVVGYYEPLPNVVAVEPPTNVRQRSFLAQPEAKKVKLLPITAAKVEKWQREFSWLKDLGLGVDKNGEEDVFTRTVQCTVCAASKIKSTREQGLGTSGTVKDKYDLNQHNSTTYHAKALDEMRQPSITAGLAKMTQAARVTAFTGVEAMLMVALFMVSHHIPLCNFGPQLQMHAALGCVVLASRHQFNHIRYVWRCLFALSGSMLHVQMAAARASPFFALACDTSMDLTAQDHLVIVIRYLDTSTLSARTQYLCTVDMKEKNADAITRVLLAVMRAMELDIRKLVSFAADGDSTMMGRWKGVAAQLAKEAKHLISVHCIAHRTALVMNDAHKSVEGLAEVDKCLKLAHALFAKSSKKSNAWKEHAEPFGVTQFKFPRFCVTRWFSRMQCLKVLCKSLLVFLVFLVGYTLKSRHESWPAGVNAYKHLSKVYVVAVLFMVQDVVGPVEYLSKQFQLECLLPHRVATLMSAFKMSMQVVRDCEDLKDLPALGDFLSSLSKKRTWRSVFGGKDVQLQLNGPYEKDVLVAFKNELAGSILRSMDERFCDTAVLEAFKIFDPASYTQLNADTVKYFGDDYLKDLCRKFSDVLGIAGPNNPGRKEVYVQFCSMKTQVLAMAREPGCTLNSMWLHLQQGPAVIAFPKMLMLVHIMLVIMVHSADVERMFSLARVTKHRLTNRLHVHTLDSLMRIKCLGPKVPKDIQAYDYSEAVKMHVDKSCTLLDALFAACDMCRLPMAEDADASMVDDLPVGVFEDENDDGTDDDIDDFELFSSVDDVEPVVEADLVIVETLGAADAWLGGEEF
jgi:Domain of unknown function (DUF4371)